MKYDLSNTNELKDFESKVIHLKDLSKIVELKECKNTRTLQQNKALHKFFMLICEQLNELGMSTGILV